MAANELLQFWASLEKIAMDQLAYRQAHKAWRSQRIYLLQQAGEVEQALAGIGYHCLVMARPSLLVGDRSRLGQPERAGERIGLQALYEQWFPG